MHTSFCISFLLIAGLSVTLYAGEPNGFDIANNDPEPATEKTNADYYNDFSYTISGLTVSYTYNCPADSLCPEWRFGDGNMTKASKTEHTYATMGTYLACMDVTDPATDDKLIEICKYIQIADPSDCSDEWKPVCGCDNRTYQNACYAEDYHGVYYWTEGPCEQFDYSLSPDFGYFVANLQVSCINASSGSYDTFEWDFGDGNKSSKRNPVHAYQKAGTYMMCLNVSSIITGFSADICHEVEVGNRPDGEMEK